MNEGTNLLDHVKPYDKAAAVDLARISAFVGSDLFLQSLGKDAATLSREGFNIVSDIERAQFLMTSQGMWDTKGADEKYFVGIAEDMVKLYPKEYSSNERNARRSLISEGIEDYCAYLAVRMSEVLIDVRAVESLEIADPSGMARSEIEYFVNSDVPNEVEAYLRILVLGAQYGGLRKWPVADYFCKCFESGYLPCGWVGPEPRHGGDPASCMQVLSAVSVD